MLTALDSEVVIGRAASPDQLGVDIRADWGDIIVEVHDMAGALVRCTRLGREQANELLASLWLTGHSAQISDSVTINEIGGQDRITIHLKAGAAYLEHHDAARASSNTARLTPQVTAQLIAKLLNALDRS